MCLHYLSSSKHNFIEGLITHTHIYDIMSYIPKEHAKDFIKDIASRNVAEIHFALGTSLFGSLLAMSR